MQDGRLSRAIWLILLLGAWASPIVAQEVPKGTARLRGIVFDSTTMKPLAEARVVVMGTTAAGWSDAEGRFRLEDIPGSPRQVSFFHPRLQALGVSAIPQQVDFRDGVTAEVTLAVPSESSLLKAWCLVESEGPGFAPLAGVVRDTLTGVPLPRATVTVRAGADVTSQRREAQALTARTDETGYYRFCNVPAGPVLLQAHFGMSSGFSIPLDLEPGQPRVQDLSMTLSSVGQLQGVVADYATGQPVAGASVRLLGTHIGQLTGDDGRFLLDSIPPGRQVVQTEYLGYATRMDSVTVFSNEAVRVELKLTTEPIAIEGMVVTARGRIGEAMIDLGRRTDYIGPDRIQSMLPRVRDMQDLLTQSAFPGLSIRDVIFRDAGAVATRGLCIESTRLQRNPEGCQMVMVILDGVPLPRPEESLALLIPETIESIQYLGPMEATTQYGTQAGGGAVLIRTKRGGRR